jgi:hypothetical protein
MPQLPGHGLTTKSWLLDWGLDCTVLNQGQLVQLAYDLFMLTGVMHEVGLQVGLLVAGGSAGSRWVCW